MVDAATALASAAASAAATGASAALPALKLAGPVPMLNNPGYAALDNLANAGAVLVFILLLVKFGRGFVANISVLLGIVAGCVVASALGAWLGGLAIAAGLGWTATGWVGVLLALAGMGVFGAALWLDRRSRGQQPGGTGASVAL